MKNNFNIFFLIGIISSNSLLFSCGREDENPMIDPIVGTWTYSSFEYDANINGQNYISYLTENYGIGALEAQLLANAYFLQELEDRLESLRITFNSDGTYVLREGSNEESGTYSLQNNNSQLTLISDSETNVYEVTELTDNTLNLSFTEEELEDFDDDGEDENIEFNVLVNFTK